MYNEVKIDNVDLTVINILTQISGSHSVLRRVLRAVVNGGQVSRTCYHTCLQLKEAWNVVQNRKQYSRTNIEGTWPIMSNLRQVKEMQIINIIQSFTLKKGCTTVVYLSILIDTVRQIDPVNPIWASGSIIGTK